MPLNPNYKKHETQKLTSLKPEIILNEYPSDCGKTWVFDCETTSLDWWDNSQELLYLCLYDIDRNKIYLFNGHALNIGLQFLQKLCYIDASSNYTLIGHNAKFDLHWCKIENPQIEILDTCVGCFMLDENESAGLKESVKRLFGYEMRKFQDVVGTITEEVPANTKKGTRKKTRTRRLEEVPIEEVAEYVSDDVYWTWQLWEKYVRPGIEKDLRISQNFYQIQMPLLKVLYAMECRGVQIDITEAKNLLKSYENALRAIDIQVDQILGENEVNLDSPMQLDNLFYSVLHYRRPPFRSARKDDEGKKLRANTRRTSYA